MLPLALIAKIGLGLAKGGAQAFGTGQDQAQGQSPMAGLGQMAGDLWRRRKRPGEGADLPNNPLMQPTDIGRFPMQPMYPAPDPGFQPARPRFPGDPGIDPGMNTPPDNPGFGPVPLGGMKRRRWQFGQGGY